MAKTEKRASRPVSQWLESGSATAQVADRARRLARTRERISRMLPDGLSPHLALANIRGDEAIFIADSPVFQQRAHYMQAELLRIVERCTGQPIGKCRVIVEPARTARQAPPAVIGISEPIARYLSSAAAALEHEGIRAALSQLAGMRNRDNDIDT